VAAPAGVSERVAAEAALVRLLNDELRFARKSFGMHSQSAWDIRAVDTRAITVAIRTSRLAPAGNHRWLVHNVRNAILNFLRDLLPVPELVAVHTDPAHGVHEVSRVPFATPELTRGGLPSALVIIEEVADRRRQEIRPAVTAAWARLCRAVSEVGSAPTGSAGRVTEGPQLIEGR
jgi:hypothetical protein